jgi:hypothetical protein
VKLVLLTVAVALLLPSAAPARSDRCHGFARYGYVFHRTNVGCALAKRVAHRAVRRGFISRAHNCRRARTWHLRHWRVRGPLANDMTYRFTSRGRRFDVSDPGDCRT